MNTLSYQMPTFIGLMSHGWQPVVFVRDEAEEEKLPTLVDIQVQSGDYFVTLATQLDSIGSQLVNWSARSKLEDAVSDLIYLQDNYRITKKDEK